MYLGEQWKWANQVLELLRIAALRSYWLIVCWINCFCHYMIEFQHISKAFDGRAVLDGISGKFEQGKVNLVIGASGAGKSVLIKCIVGLINPEQGKVTFDGRDFLNGTRDLRLSIRREIGMLFQGGLCLILRM